MRGLRTGSIGLVVPTVDNAIFAELIQAFSDHLNSQELTMLIGSHGYDLELETRLLRSLLEHRVDGIAVVGFDHLDASYALLESQNVPAIALWNYSETSRITCVGPENREAGRLVALHVLELGHRDIAFCFPELDGNDRARHRLEGAMEVFREAGLSVPADRLLRTPYNIESAKIAGLDLLRQSDRPSALICGNDVIAQGTIFAALALGIELPRDLSVVGIGDFAGSAEMEPGLSSVRIPARRIGKLGAKMLIDALEPGGRSEIIRRRIELSFIKRRSTGVWHPDRGGPGGSAP